MTITIHRLMQMDTCD